MQQQINWMDATTYVLDPYLTPWYFGVSTGEDLGSVLALERLTDQWHQVEQEQLNGARVDALSMSVAEGRSLAAQLFYRSIGSYANYTGGSLPALMFSQSAQYAMRCLVKQKTQLLKSFKGPCEIDVLELHAAIQCKVYCSDFVDDSMTVDQDLQRAIQNQEIGALLTSNAHAGEDKLVLFNPSAVKSIAPQRRLCLVWNGQKITRIYAKEAADEYAAAIAS